MCLSMCLSLDRSRFPFQTPAHVLLAPLSRLFSFLYTFLISQTSSSLLNPGLSPALCSPTPTSLTYSSTHRPIRSWLWLTPYSYILFLYALRTRHPTPPTRFALMALYDARASRYATALLFLRSKARTLYIL